MKRTKSQFYFHQLHFISDNLLIVVGRIKQPDMLIIFPRTRAFRLVSESGFGGYLQKHDWHPLIGNRRKDAGVYCSTSTPYLLDHKKSLSEDRLDMDLRDYAVITPQECIEVISCEDPIVEEIDQRSH